MTKRKRARKGGAEADTDWDEAETDSYETDTDWEEQEPVPTESAPPSPLKKPKRQRKRKPNVPCTCTVPGRCFGLPFSDTKYLKVHTNKYHGDQDKADKKSNHDNAVQNKRRKIRREEDPTYKEMLYKHYVTRKKKIQMENEEQNMENEEQNTEESVEEPASARNWCTCM
jgi:hypothetical protein